MVFLLHLIFLFLKPTKLILPSGLLHELFCLLEILVFQIVLSLALSFRGWLKCHILREAVLEVSKTTSGFKDLLGGVQEAAWP